MDLAGAIELDDRALVALVGAGGKKTAMARLVEQASERGLAAGYTTTTHVPPPALPVVLSEPAHLETVLENESPPVAFARSAVEQPERADRKLRGFEPAVIDWLHRTRRFDWLLVKADGARRRAFKAPGPDEPALPDDTTHLVAVASIGAVGAPLDSAHVHRPEQVAAITDCALGDEITAAMIGTVLASPDGGLKGVPETAAVTLMVNQADTDELAATARDALKAAFGLVDRPVHGLITSFETDRCTVLEP